MIYVGIAVVLGIALLIDRIDRRRIRKATRIVQQAHQDYYDYVDAHFSGIDAFREKAEADYFLHDYWEHHLNVIYDPDIPEVTTARDRRRMAKGEDIFRTPGTDDTILVRVKGDDLIRNVADLYEMDYEDIKAGLEKFHGKWKQVDRSSRCKR